MCGEKTVIKLNDENWDRGNGSGYLCNGERMCILGHVLKAVGIDPSTLDDNQIPSPELLDGPLSALPMGELMDINDSMKWLDGEGENESVPATDELRVKQFNQLLREHDIEVVFENAAA